MLVNSDLSPGNSDLSLVNSDLSPLSVGRVFCLSVPSVYLSINLYYKLKINGQLPGKQDSHSKAKISDQIQPKNRNL